MALICSGTVYFKSLTFVGFCPLTRKGTGMYRMKLKQIQLFFIKTVPEQEQ